MTASKVPRVWGFQVFHKPTGESVLFGQHDEPIKLFENETLHPLLRLDDVVAWLEGEAKLSLSGSGGYDQEHHRYGAVDLQQ